MSIKQDIPNTTELDAILGREKDLKSSTTPGQWSKENHKSEIMDRVMSKDMRYPRVISEYLTPLNLIPVIFLAMVVLFTSKSSSIDYVAASKHMFDYFITQSFHRLYTTAIYAPEILLGIILILVCIIWLFISDRQKAVYLVDFATFTPDDDLIIKRDEFVQKSRDLGAFTDSSIQFQEKILDTSCIGENTYFPPGIMKHSPPDLSMQSARGEASLVMFGAIDELFRTNRVNPKSIDFIITNCSLFCPTPSLSAMIVNHYKMRNDVITYSLGGMGCSAGLISIDLAKRLLEHTKNSTCLVVSTENITQNWYHGNDKSMLLSNCLFRCGAAAILLSNKSSDKSRSQLELKHCIRTHMGALDDCYECVYQCEDVDGKRGVRLSRQVMQVAGDALKNNITTLGPLVLPISEQIKFLLNFIMRRCINGQISKSVGISVGKVLTSLATWSLSIPIVGPLIRTLTSLPQDLTVPLPGPAFVPDFKKAFDHFCIHAGGRAVLDAMEKNLNLTADLLAPSRHVLNRFGNTSSSSIWYELDYLRSNGLLKKGQTIWQIAFGSGFKCNSGVWKVLKAVNKEH